MSEAAAREREARRRSMLPGGPRDALVAIAKWGFPAASVLLLVVLIVSRGLTGTDHVDGEEGDP